MKARDIIPGWPRGRSTIAPLSSGQHAHVFFGRLSEQSCSELELNAEYHRQQGKMLERHRWQQFVDEQHLNWLSGRPWISCLLEVLAYRGVMSYSPCRRIVGLK